MPEFDMNALDSLLSGNTTNKPAEEPKDPEDVEPTVEPEPAEPADGGDPDNLESSDEPAQAKETPEDDEGADKAQAQSAQNAAFAKMRTENKNLAKTVQQIAQALGIQEKDPAKLSEALVNMAQEKLAKESNLPVEVYRELNSTKEQLAMLQMQQNQVSAREKFANLKTEYGLEDKELIRFAETLDQEGINVIHNPNVDLSYEYYRRNREALEQKKIAMAVEEALRKSNTADSKSSTPSKQQGKKPEPTAKVNNVSALNDLLNGK